MEVATDVLSDRFMPELRAELRRQLFDLGVDLLLGSPLREKPPTAPGEFGAFDVTTETGQEITADIWFQCFGVSPVSDYLTGTLSKARAPDGFLRVNKPLQLEGQKTVFALGDVSCADAKMAGFAGLQAGVVASNIKALIAAGSELTPYVSLGPPSQ